MRSVYVETTVVSYFVARPSRDVVVAARQESTRELWQFLLADYDCCVSMLVLEEAGKGESEYASRRLSALSTFVVLEIDDSARDLAARIIQGHGIPREFPEDALHIAVAAVNGIDVLLIWNFAHLNNPFTRRIVRQIVEVAGFECPEICSPDELLESN